MSYKLNEELRHERYYLFGRPDCCGDGRFKLRGASLMETIVTTQHDGRAAAPAFAQTSYVEWPAIFAGAAIALAVIFVLGTFGAAVGLSAVSPWTSTHSTVIAVSFGAIFWMILVHIWAFGIGGYLSGRMRHRHGDGVPAETEFRDGAHGALVWALAVTVGAVVAAFMAASIARGGVDLSTSTNNDPVSVASDTLLRTTNSSAALEPSLALRGSVVRILTRPGIGSLTTVTASDRTFLTQLVAARAGIPLAEADERISAALVQMKVASDRVRRTAVVFGFMTAATLLLGAAAAWWGATVGGHDRDANTIWRGLGGRVPFANAWYK